MPEWSWWSWVVGAVCGVGLTWLLVLLEHRRQQVQDEEERRR